MSCNERRSGSILARSRAAYWVIVWVLRTTNFVRFGL